jgi:hypothetical protein
MRKVPNSRRRNFSVSKRNFFALADDKNYVFKKRSTLPLEFKDGRKISMDVKPSVMICNVGLRYTNNIDLQNFGQNYIFKFMENIQKQKNKYKGLF